MLKNSLMIDVLRDCNSFNILSWYPSLGSKIEFNIFFIYSSNPNKIEIIDYFNKDSKYFNLFTIRGIKELKKYLSINSIHSLFIYGDKQTEKTLKTILETNKNRRYEDFLIDVYNHCFHIKGIFKNFNEQIIKLNISKNISSAEELSDIFQQIDQSIQIQYESPEFIFNDKNLISLFNYKEFNKYFNTNFTKNTCFETMDELYETITEAIKAKLLKEKSNLNKTIFLDLEAIDYSSECTSIGLIYNNTCYKKIIRPLKNTKPTKFMVDLTGITREMILNGTLFKDMINELYENIPDFANYKYLVFGVFDKVIWESSFDSNMTESSKQMYNFILDNFYDFSALTNTYMVDYTITNNNLSLINSLKFIGVSPLNGIHDPIIDAKNLKLLYENFFDEKNFSKYIKNNISFYMKKSISSSNFKTLLFCLYSSKKDKTIFEYYLRHKTKENIKNLENNK